MHNNYPHQIKETFHTQRHREGGNSISVISSIRKDLLFIKKGEKRTVGAGWEPGTAPGGEGGTHRSGARPGVAGLGSPAAGDEGLPGSVLLPHPNSSSPGSQNPLLWFLGELLA